MANNITDLVIDDEYIKEMAKFIQENGELFEKYYQKYVDLIETYSEYGTMSGETAKSVKKYLQVADRLRDYIQEVTEDIRYMMDYYLDDIDEADRDLC